MRDEYQDLFDIYGPLGVAVFVVVTALVLFVLVRFRASRGGPPSSREENKPAEVIYGLGLACVVAALLYLTLTTNSDISAQNARPGRLRVDVTAAKWDWRFDYPSYGISQQGSRTRPATLVVPADTDVRFELTAVDVQHAFWIPDLRFKRDAFPARRTGFVLSFPDPGFHRGAGACAEFCGLRHSNMTFNVDVLEPRAFERWARDRQAEERRV